MGTEFINEFVAEKAASASQSSSGATPPKDAETSEMPTVPGPTLPFKHPKHETEQLMKHLPREEIVIDRYVDQFFTKYNWYVHKCPWTCKASLTS